MIEPRTAPRQACGIVIGLAVIAVGAAYAWNASRRVELDLGTFRLVEVSRANTGHQRAERVAFADRGRVLAVACPRYDRVVFYRVTARETLELLRDVALDGRPVALWPTRDRMFVLARPTGDARHVEEGFFETFDFRGNRVGDKVRVGFDPDDLVVTADGRRAIVVNSGHAEGEAGRPAPALLVVDLGADGGGPRVVGRVSFEGASDDPERITLSSRQTHAAVTLRGTRQIVGVLLVDPERPTLTARMTLPKVDVPACSRKEDDAIWLSATTDTAWVVLDVPGPFADRSYVITTAPDASGLDVFDARNRRRLGRLPLRGSGNLGTVLPTDLAHAPERGLLAIAQRSGGVSLVAIRRDRPATELEVGSVASPQLAHGSPR